ncbi:MAG: DnaB-like helicase N-terminal domain-containing protein, partial [Bacteroidales bacterium]|nr:DnaB-like helicase N-terminal domain-containing protein [Bacteroidales bacterium]
MEERKNYRNSKNRQTPMSLSEIGRRPPEARELEEAVLGALMLEKDAYSIVSDILMPKSFYEHTHELIYSAIQNLAILQRPVDMLTVQEQL